MIEQSSIGQLKIEVQCKLCGATISLDLNDESTFLSKTEHQKFFGTQLFTYRVEHLAGKEKHINVFLADHKALFRGYIDAYVERVSSSDASEISESQDYEDYIYLSKEISSITENKTFNFFVITKHNQWVQEIVKSSELNTYEILRILDQKIEESEKIYKKIPSPLKVSIADLEVYIWVKKTSRLIVSVKDRKKIPNISPLIQLILDIFYISPNPPRKRALKLFAQIVNETIVVSEDKNHFQRLLSDDLFYSTIKVKYPDRIPKIIQRISERFSISATALEEILLEEASIIDILENDVDTRMKFKEMIEVIDFINRRNLIEVRN